MPVAPTPIRRVVATALALVAVTVLAACVEQPPQLPNPEPTPSSTSTTAPTPSAAPSDGTIALDVACATLVSPDTMYAFDPNFALLDGWTPEPGSAASDARAADGVACRWVRESGGATLDLSVARLPEGLLDARKNAAFAASQMVPTYGDEAYFEVTDGRGEAIVFQGDAWLVVSSEAFAEPGEATAIVEAALSSLPE